MRTSFFVSPNMLSASFLALSFLFLSACELRGDADLGPPPSDVFGNADYRAMSFGGYRGLTREEGPSIDELIDDVRILDAMGVKLLRTYNTSQFPQAERLLEAISRIKESDASFEMYVMLGTWIEAKNSWTEAVWDAENDAWIDGTGPDHSQGNVGNNTREIETAIRLANRYPDIVKAISVGNEAMVQWAVSYFVYPKTILKWVNHLQHAKTSGELSADIWVTSSDNYESWGGGNETYQTPDLAALMAAVDFVSVHTYPFHDSFYNPTFWGVLPHEEARPFEEMTEAAIARAVIYAQGQFEAVQDYMASINIDKPIHIGETGWATTDGAAYGSGGSKAADEYKQKLFHDRLREWTDEAGITLFFFEGFDEQWKNASSPDHSENHFGLITLNNEVKYVLWDAFDAGNFIGLSRDGKPLRKTFGGERQVLLQSTLAPPFRSQMAARRITTMNAKREPGEAVDAERLIIVHEVLSGNDAGATFPSAKTKLTPWEGTSSIELMPNGEIRIETRGGDWWGASLELDADTGENLSKFKEGTLHFEIRGSDDLSFSLGFQTGSYLAGDQINNFASFGPDTTNSVTADWESITLNITDIDGGSDMTNVTNLIALMSQEKAAEKVIYLRNIYFSQ